MANGKLWWVADDEAELAEVRTRLESSGAVFTKIDRAMDPPRINYEFELDKARALEILGYEPADEEWLEE